MEEAIQYGQQDFNLPHDVVTLPSQGKFYKNKKKSLKDQRFFFNHDEISI